jgi:hypothetical protein
LSIEALGNALNNLPTQQIANLQQQLQQRERANPVVDGLNAIPGAARPAGAAMVEAFAAANTAAVQLNTTVGNIMAQFRRLAQGGGNVPAGNVQAGREMFGGIAGGYKYAATGGLAELFPGRPKGTDILPYWLTPGEFIMPAAQTRRFFTQLLAMRSGFQPKYAAEGGVVVGDINITMQGSGPPEKTVREIGRGLDREIRRGTIRLGRK